MTAYQTPNHNQVTRLTADLTPYSPKTALHGKGERTYNPLALGDVHVYQNTTTNSEVWILEIVLQLTSKIGVITRDSEESPFSQIVSFILNIGAVEPHHLSQCLDPADDLDEVFFHPELPVHVNKQTDLPAYLKQLALERIGDTPIDIVQVYTDGSRDHYYRSGSGIYIKSQDYILRIQRRNPDGCSVFRSELIAIDEALGSLASLPNGKEIWILSDSRSAIQHLSNWQSWIPSHIDLERNEVADTLAKAGACEVPEPSAPLAFLEIFSRTKHQNKTAWITPRALLVSVFSSWRLSGSRFYKTGSNSFSPLSRSGHIKSMKFSEGRKSFEMCTNCFSEPATPAHILECIGLTKQDLADVPLLVLDFLNVYDVMDLV
ncbi:RNase H domain-containing protein [Trichonephila clavipes]|uniref:RNase H domain-containing protein n=1 Tax=Trichonephila clavipes TaxID=2585209 RepID=A0A8X6VZQ5_TRICX|nr:RNase H domain-containing protein [Trichonephila clavipes]